MFYHKWAVLMDSEDMQAGAKGYLKVDIAVVGKGENIKVTPRPEREEDENNIEANLLLPKGAACFRQQACYVLRINSLHHLLMESSGLVANVRKALSSGTTSPTKHVYVQVSFAGHTACTTVCKSSGEAEWNEEIVFAEVFPPVVRRIRICLRSSDAIGASVLATYFLDITKVSDEGRSGFLPTFGPAYVHMYGSSTSSRLLNSSRSEISEGVIYRGTLLLSLRVDVLDENSALVPSVQVSPCLPALQNSLGVKDDFLLFGCIMNVSMLDIRLVGKPVQLQMQFGHLGSPEFDKCETGSEFGDSFSTLPNATRSATPKLLAESKSEYCFLPFGDSKPCVFMRGAFPNLSWRCWHSNFINKMADDFATRVTESRFLLDCFKLDEASERFRGAVDGLISDCCQYLSYVCSRSGQTGSNKLDKERRRLSQRQIDCIASYARNLKALSNKDTLEQRLDKSQLYVKQLKALGFEPQPPFPDLIIWLVQGQKRLAYHRIYAQDLIYSPLANERGNYCAKLHSFYLKVPSPDPSDADAYRIKGQVTASFWFGHNSTRQGLLDGLPKGYNLTPDILSINRPNAVPPAFLEFSDKYYFELHSFLYQGRSLLASDRTGLSDPFAKIVFEGQTKTTQVIEKTLNPFWDETIKIGPMTLYGHPGDIVQNPPVVVLEIFDYDKLGKGDFMGQLLAKPQVILTEAQSDSRPSVLQWHPVFRGSESGGEVLAAFELIQVDNEFDESDVVQLQQKNEPKPVKIPIPDRFRLPKEKYKMEVLFWGLRNLNRINLLSVDKPRVDIESNGRVLCSSSIADLSKNPNFSTMCHSFEIDLPSDPLFWPALSIRCVDCRSFGRDTLVGVHSIHRLSSLLYTPTNGNEEREHPIRTESVIIDVDGEPALILADSRLASDTHGKRRNTFIRMLSRSDQSEEKTQLDWWSKYFASVEHTIQDETLTIATEQKNGGSCLKRMNMKPNLSSLITSPLSALNEEQCFVGIDDKHILRQAISDRKNKKSIRMKKRRSINYPCLAKLKLYTSALESQPEFEGFQDWIKAFDLYRGRKTFDNDEQMRMVGRFKGALRISRMQPTLNERSGLFTNLPSNDPILVLVRIYIVKASDLHPSDLNGKADPYLYLTLGKTKINDKGNYVSKQLNPTFGKLFEVEALFPQESQLTVQVYDWDLVGRDDLIGETKIDLEDRFYSRHRATCGISEKYETVGYNYWRDPHRPSQILQKLCRDNGVEGPLYMPGQVRVGCKTFHIPVVKDQSPGTTRSNTKVDTEQLALQALRNWDKVPRVGTHLVPEHVETRSLFHPDRPGIVQGKLEMWIDMFTMDVITPPPVEISPRKPKSYELRVIIWNTDDVVLEDDAFFTGEKMSDIYVKGWIKGPEDTQSTDIHYRSLTGEGNFNWRFVFPFEYLEAEEKIVVCRKENMFSWDETEIKLPPRLELQVWDADHFSADDFLGSLSLNLTMMPRGAKTSPQCVIDMINEDSDAPTINLFKQRRVKGWWPFVAKNDENGEIELTGKVEAEFHLLAEDEIEINPAGFGRSEPNPLDKPRRPDSSFVWFINPLKSMRYVLWHNYKWLLVKILIIVLVLLMFALFIYSAPGYIMKRMIGA